MELLPPPLPKDVVDWDYLSLRLALEKDAQAKKAKMKGEADAWIGRLIDVLKR